MSEETLIVRAGPEQVVLEDDQIDEFWDRAREAETDWPDPFVIAKSIVQTNEHDGQPEHGGAPPNDYEHHPPDAR